MDTLDNFSFAPPFESSNLHLLAYDEVTNVLYAQFQSQFGPEYTYDDVPAEVWEELLIEIADGNSVGKAFNRLIKKGGYKFHRLEPEPVEEDIQAQVKERILSGVEVGMLWFDNNKKMMLDARILKAVAYYRDKYRVHPHVHLVVDVSPDDFPTLEDGGSEYACAMVSQGDNITVRKVDYILPNHMLISEAHV